MKKHENWDALQIKLTNSVTDQTQNEGWLEIVETVTVFQIRIDKVIIPLRSCRFQKNFNKGATFKAFFAFAEYNERQRVRRHFDSICLHLTRG